MTPEERLIDTLQRETVYVDSQKAALDALPGDEEQRFAHVTQLAITHPDDLVRTNALSLLCDCHHSSLPLLQNLAQHDPHPRVRARAVQQLRMYLDDPLIGSIAQNDPHAWVREDAIRVLYDGQLVAHIACKHESAHTRACARRRLSALHRNEDDPARRHSLTAALRRARLAMIPPAFVSGAVLLAELVLTSGLVGWAFYTLMCILTRHTGDPWPLFQMATFICTLAVTANVSTRYFFGEYSPLPDNLPQLAGRVFQYAGILIVPLILIAPWLFPDAITPDEPRSPVTTIESMDTVLSTEIPTAER